MGSVYPDCPFEKRDCFAYMRNGLCHCLQNTSGWVYKEECPFYKPEDKVDHELVLAKYSTELELDRRWRTCRY